VIACRSSTYEATGEVVEIDPDAMHVTIDHDDVPGLMPAMRMRFATRDAGVLHGIAPGSEVRFRLARDGETLRVVAVEAMGGTPRPRPGIHDHRPHHGGVVTMVGLRHVEIAAEPDGRVRVYLTDAWRRPLPLDDWQGEVVLDQPGGSHTVGLAAGEDAFAGSAPAFSGSEVLAHLRLSREGEDAPLEAHMTVPLRPGTQGTGVAPVVRCDGATGDAPRCTFTFSQGVTTLDPIAGTTRVAIGVVGAGVSVWDAATGAFASAFEAPPSLATAATGLPHPEIVDALATSPDGAQAVVASEGRLLRYAVASGRLLRVMPSPEVLLRELVWERAESSLVVIGAYGSQAWRVSASDGTRLADLRMPARVTAAAASNEGRILLGDEAGHVRSFDRPDDEEGRPLANVPPPVRGLGLAGGRVVVATGKGTLEVLDAERGLRVAASAPASPCYRLAVSERAGLAACAAFDRTIRLHDLASAAATAVLVRHEALVLGLAWVETTLLSGDGAGVVAVWERKAR
jgi:Cu/Ag efflux protein CusF